MITNEQLQNIKNQLPTAIEATGSEKEMRKLLKATNLKLRRFYENFIQEFNRNFKLTPKQTEKFLDTIINFEDGQKITEVIEDEEEYFKLNKKWLEYQAKFFKLHEKKINTGCDEYEVKYILQSDFYQFFHENPENRRKRIEDPIDSEIQKIEELSDNIERKMNELVSYKLRISSNDFLKNFNAFYDKIIELQENKHNW